jgi:hypothetical protein
MRKLQDVVAYNDVVFRQFSFKIYQPFQELKGEKHAETGLSFLKLALFLEEEKWADERGNLWLQVKGTPFSNVFFAILNLSLCLIFSHCRLNPLPIKTRDSNVYGR